MRKFKITKEQYNRLIKNGLLKEEAISKKEKPSYGTNDPIEKETKELISYFYRHSADLSTFWEEHGVTYDEICNTLKNKHLIIKKGDKYMVSKELGSKEEAIDAIEKELRILAKLPEKEIEVSENDNLPPGAQNHPDAPWNKNDEEENVENHTLYDLFVYNNDVAIFKKYKSNDFFLMDLDEHHVDHEGPQLEDNDIINFLNNNERDLEQFLIPLTEELVNELSEMYNLNSFFMKRIEQIKAMMNGLNDNIEETSAAGGSSGAFTGPLNSKIINRKIQETTVADAGNFQYDTPGIVGISRDGKFSKNKKQTKAQSTPQWAGGSFVEQPECSKLNNNKEAQNGGCNSGASSLKTKKGKGSINAPSLKEESIYKQVAKQTGKTIEEVKRIINLKKITN